MPQIPKVLYHGTTGLRYIFGINVEGLRVDTVRSYESDKKHLGYSFWTSSQSEARQHGVQTLAIDLARDAVLSRVNDNGVEYGEDKECHWFADGVPMAGPPHSYTYDLKKRLRNDKKSLEMIEEKKDVILVVSVETRYLIQAKVELDPEQEQSKEKMMRMFPDLRESRTYSAALAKFHGVWWRYKGNIPANKIRVVQYDTTDNLNAYEKHNFRWNAMEAVTAR